MHTLPPLPSHPRPALRSRHWSPVIFTSALVAFETKSFEVTPLMIFGLGIGASSSTSHDGMQARGRDSGDDGLFEAHPCAPRPQVLLYAQHLVLSAAVKPGMVERGLGRDALGRIVR